MNFNLAYWRSFDFTVRRIIGPVFAVGGLFLSLTFLPSAFPGGTIDVDGVESSDIVIRVFAVVFPLLIAILGVALFRAEPYYPKNVDPHRK